MTPSGRALADCGSCGHLIRNLDFHTNHMRWFCRLSARFIHSLRKCQKEINPK